MTIRLRSQRRSCRPVPACPCTHLWRRTYQRRQWGHLGSSPQCTRWRSRFGTYLNSRSAWYNPRIDCLTCHRSRPGLCSTSLPCRQRKGRWSSRRVRSFRRNRCRWRTSRIDYPDKVASVLGSPGPCYRFRERPGRTRQQAHQGGAHPIPSWSLLLPSERRCRRLPRRRQHQAALPCRALLAHPPSHPRLAGPLNRARPPRLGPRQGHLVRR
jgi:hypothetical protein